MRRILFIIAMVGCAVSIQAQYYSTGSDPGLLSWRYINTDHFKVIFPADYHSQAQRLANILEQSYTLVPKTLNSNLPRTQVIVHSKSSVSNGVTAWAPRRIELFPVPNQSNFYNHDWLEQLAIHEYRHICQFNAVNRGLTNVGRIVFGQAATGVVSGIIPPYVYEGDAVVTETALSRAGRGRQPWFQMELRAQLIEKRAFYHYRKASLGSYRDHVPDYYQFGYLYVASVRDKYGYSVWDNTFRYVGSHPFLAYPARRDGKTFLFSSYSRALKKNTGLHRDALYRSSFARLDSLWWVQDTAVKETRFAQISRTDSVNYTSYHYPSLYREVKYEMPASKTLRFKTNSPSFVVAEKSGIDQLTTFVKIDQQGNEEKLHTPGLYVSDNLSVSWPLMAWIEMVPDIRWEHRTYHVVKIKNLETGEVRYLTRHTRYMYPVISPDASSILVVDYRNDHTFALTLINPIDGHVMVTHPVPGNIQPLNPCWDPDNTTVYAIINDDAGKRIASLNVRTGQWKTLYDPGDVEMYQLNADSRNIYFRSGYTGIENIFALSKADSRVYQVTSSRFGAFDPCSTGDTLFYSDYSSYGSRVVRMPIDTAKWKPFSAINPRRVELVQRAAREENAVLLKSRIPDTAYDVHKYSKFAHLVKIHSWTPFYWPNVKVIPELVQVMPGIKVNSQNMLGTAIAYGGLAFDQVNVLPFYFAGFTYSGWFPVFDFQTLYGGYQGIVRPDLVPYTESIEKSVKLRSRVYLPLNLSRDKYYTLLYPEVNFEYSNTRIYDGNLNSYMMDHRLIYKIQHYRYLKKSQRDITPRIGYGLEMMLIHTPNFNHVFGPMWNGLATVYIPGLAKHHSIKLTAGMEQHQQKQYLLGGQMGVARGYVYDTGWYNNTLFYDQLKKITVDYFLPIAYPDVSIADIFYITRFSAAVFYDYSSGIFRTSTGLKAHTLQSAGVDWTFEIHMFHAQIPVSFTYRTVYLIGVDDYRAGFFISTDLMKF